MNKANQSEIENIVDILMKQDIKLFFREAAPIINELFRRDSDNFFILMEIFNYGYILGKRAERARRSRKKSGGVTK